MVAELPFDPAGEGICGCGRRVLICPSINTLPSPEVLEEHRVPGGEYQLYFQGDDIMRTRWVGSTAGAWKYTAHRCRP